MSRNLRTRQFSALAIPVRLGIMFLLVLVALALKPVLVAHADDITVNSTADDTTPDGYCTLREAITNANNDAATYSDCVAGSGHDTLTITATGVITLTGGQLEITSTLTINGPGAGDLAISGNNASRVISITSGITVAISSVMVRDGYVNNSNESGGGIYSAGVLTLTNCTVYTNTVASPGTYGGGIKNYQGTLAINNCTISDNYSFNNGGGIDNDRGTTTINNSTINGNIGYNGGGIENYSGTLTITNSTISGNRAEGGGGGIDNYKQTTLTIVNSTIYSNTAVGDGGGIYNSDATSTLNVRNTILANNTTGGSGPDCNDIGTLNSLGYNLVLTDTGCTGVFTATGDITGTNPLLGPLADNGGDTWTHAPQIGSPVIDAIPEGGSNYNGAPATDQRGVSRPQALGCDIGAYESNLSALTLSKSVDDDMPKPGQLITYTITIANGGVISATNALVSDTLPDDLTYAGPLILDPPGTTLPDPSGSILASGLVITNGTSITLTFPVTVNVGSGGMVIINTAVVTSTEVITPVTGAVTLTVRFSDLTIVKTADPEPAIAGTPMTYTILITNQGDLTATNVTMSDTLPPSATLQIIDQTDADDDLLGFGGGTYQDTRWNDSRPYYEWLELSNPAITSTGVFTSRIIDASNVVTWTSLEWRPRRPTYKPLPDNGGSDENYSLGEANMMANRLLLHLDEISGTTTFADTSSNALPATCPAIISDTCPTAGAVGRFNGALAFDGASSQTIVVTDSLDPARYAIEMWVYPTVVTDTSFILRTDAPTDTAENYSHLLGIYDGHFMHATYAGGYRLITSTTAVVTGTWYHLVGTAESGGDIKLFVNGVQETKLDGVGTLWTGGDWYRLGSSYGPTGTSQYFSGRLDEVAVYSRTLSAGEVNDHYLRGALRLGFQVRTCADDACAGESFSAKTYSEQTNTGAGLPTVTFSPTLPNNRYFQYRATFETDQPNYSPELRRVRIRPDHRAVFASQGSCDASASAFTCDLGDLSGGAVITVTALVNVNPSALGIITNTAAVSATNDITATNNTAFVTSTVGSEVYLSVTKHDTWHDGTDPVNPGFPMTYTLEVHNGGPSTAWDVTVTDTLPITITGVSAPGGWTVEYTSRTVTCTIPSLLPYTWPDIIISGLAPTVEGVITNTGWVTAVASSVYTTSHISDTETTVIEFLADLSITKIAAPDPVDPGAILTYTITVTNAGPSPAYAVIVTDTMGTPGLINYPISNSDWSCGLPGTVVACVYNHLFLGATQSASFNVTTTAPLSGLIANTAVVMALTTDPEMEDNIAFAYAAVRPVADLFITKADVKDPVDAAAPLTYTLTVTNTGYVQAGARVAHLTLTNDNNIYIPTGGRATPYPSYVYLSSAEGTIRDITVTLHSLNHTYPGDLDLLLVGPNGQSVVLMANAGGGYDATDVTLTLHDSGAAMPLSGTLTSTVVYRPTNYGVGGDDGNFLAPAPDGPYGGNLSAFHNTSPNGTWQLWVYDNVASDGGSIAGGWSLALTTLTTDTVTLTDTLPAGLTGPINVTEPPDWDCSFAGSEMMCEADTFPVNAPTVFTITATAPITGGVITNTAGIASTTADYGPHRNTHTITTTITPVANLSITKTVTPDPVSADGPLTYTLAVNNAGPSPVFVTVTVTDALPADLTDVSVSGSGWTCDLAALPALTCTTGSLALGPAPNIYIFATAPVTPGVITNTAAVTTSVADPDLLDNSTVVTTTIIRRSDLLIIKSAQPEGVTPNSALTFTLSITNAGPSEAVNITVTDVLTNYGAVGSPAGTGWNCNQVGGAFTCTTGSLAVGATSIVFTATAPAVGGVMTNTATVTSSVEDLVPANNSHTIYVNVSLPPTITIPLSDYDTDEDTATVITFTVDDADTPRASLTLTATASNTTLIPPGNITFGDAGNPNEITRTMTITPAADLYGQSFITVTVHDQATGVSGVLTLTVHPVNDPPTALDDTATVAEDSVANPIDVLANDTCLPDAGETLTITAVGAAAHGVVLFGSNVVTYTPDADYFGIDVFIYTINDGTPGSIATATVTITVTSVNDPPVADAGPDQTVFVDEVVALDGSGSSDLENNLPLAYGWQQTGGAVVTLNSATASQPTFTAPDAPAVLTFSLLVTDSLGLPSDTADTVVITVTDRAIAGLQAFNDGPTIIGNQTILTASVTAGSNVAYQWAFGDGGSAAGQSVAHTYPAIGWYVATVTATNNANSIVATTQVSITQQPFSYIYLPVMLRNYANAPDLVVDSLVATSNGVTVTIENQGAAPVEDEFWVDVYINPDPPPTQVNQTWQHLCDQGLVWGVTVDVLPLNPGDTLVLTVGDSYYWSDLSVITWPLAIDTSVYAQVDSAHSETIYGAVLENHEITGGTYNNITGTLSTAANTPTWFSSIRVELLNLNDNHPAVPNHLPHRP